MVANEATRAHVGGYVPLQLAEALRALARANDRSASAELRVALTAHLEQAPAAATGRDP
jgi:hypothetical protein